MLAPYIPNVSYILDNQTRIQVITMFQAKLREIVVLQKIC